MLNVALDPVFQGAALLAVGLAFGYFLFVRPLRRRLGATRRIAKRAVADAACLRAFLGAASGGFFFWRAGGEAETAFGDFSEFLTLPANEPTRFDGVLTCLDPTVAEALRNAVAKLRTTGKSFALDVATVDGRKLKAHGRRIEAPDRSGLDEGNLGEGVWFEDVTEAAAYAAEFSEQTARLSQDRDQLRFLLDQIPFPVWRRGKDLALAFANRAYASVLGVRPDEVVAHKRELAAGVVGDGGQEVARRAQRVGSPQSESHHFVVAGFRRLLEITEIPLLDQGGMVGYAQDFTEIERVQDELGRHVDAQAKVLGAMAIAIAIYGPDMRLKFFNQAFASLWGLNESWLEKEPMQGEVLETLRARRRLPETVDFPAYKNEQLARFTSLIDPVEELLHLPDGATLRSTVLPHPFGGLLCTYEDVTNKLALERSYNTLIKVQQQSLDNLYEGVAVFGSDGRLKLSNPAYARIWGFSPDDLDDEPHVSQLVDGVKEFTCASDWPVLREKIIVGICARVSKRGRFHRQDGTTVDFASLPLTGGGVLWRYIDVTDSTRVERALRERNEALEAADKLMSEFVAHVSYEFRTPLNTIIGFTQMLEQRYFGELTDQQAIYVGGILDSSQVLLSLINDILDMAMIEAGQLEPKWEDVAVRPLLEDVLGLVQQRANEKNVIVVMDCVPNLTPIHADKQRLKQALFKLLDNAIKFSMPGGKISLSARQEKKALVLQISDAGIGVPPEEQERIFDRFERGSASKGLGLGLGLPLVRKFIELSGGRVVLESTPGKGTTVRCYLPYDRPVARPLVGGERLASAQGQAPDPSLTLDI
ncbi:PAS-domain containing protein [Rhodospirillaceae bacterium AH-315-P19]|nr:PAS-domain containing protein [Rhodospirillaceae bacterium AH-315-P19]